MPANAVLKACIAWLLGRPVGRPPHEAPRDHASFGCQARSWTKPRPAIAAVDSGEPHPSIGFIVTNMTRPGRARDAVPQPSRHGGAVDQGRQGRFAEFG